MFDWVLNKSGYIFFNNILTRFYLQRIILAIKSKLIGNSKGIRIGNSKGKLQTMFGVQSRT